MRNQFKLIDPKTAINRSTRIMSDLGFYKYSSSTDKDSFYFRKYGIPYTIRVSDHKINNNSHKQKSYADVLVEVIFDYVTIENDVKYKLEQAAKQFAKELVFRKNKK